MTNIKHHSVKKVEPANNPIATTIKYPPSDIGFLVCPYMPFMANSWESKSAGAPNPRNARVSREIETKNIPKNSITLPTIIKFE